MKVIQLVAWLLSVVSFNGLAQTYTYVDYSTPDNFEDGKTTVALDISSKQIMSSDWVNTIFVCDKLSAFYCFRYPAISFYVPKAGVVSGQRWAIGGVSFKVLRKENIRVLGLTKEAWVIKAVRLDRCDFFYYSPNDGLLAMKHVGKNGQQVQFFMVEGWKGFPK